MLNTEGRLSGAPPELVALLERSAAVFEASGGAFDVTVQPLVDLLHGSEGLADGEPPDVGAWREALERVGADAVKVTEGSVTLDRDGMGITLDGIAKGYIVDAMAAVLEAHGIDRFLIDAGGDIRASGLREDGHGWLIAVRDPRHGGILPARLRLTGGAVATSGGYEARYDPDGSWHHIVNSRSGRSPTDVLSVTVVGPERVRFRRAGHGRAFDVPAGGSAFHRLPPRIRVHGDRRRGAFLALGWLDRIDRHFPRGRCEMRSDYSGAQLTALVAPSVRHRVAFLLRGRVQGRQCVLDFRGIPRPVAGLPVGVVRGPGLQPLHAGRSSTS